MPYTAVQLVAKFRDLGGEQNTNNPTDDDVLKYLSLARNGDENVFLDLLPKLSSEMSTVVSTQSVNFTADTAIYALSTVPEKITKLFVKWGTTDKYYPVDNFTYQPLYENSPEALNAQSESPVVGIANGNLYVYPKPSQAVTAGALLFQLSLPDDLAISDSVVESNRVALIAVKKSLQIWMRAMKRYEEATYWESEFNKSVAKALGTASGNPPEKRIPKNKGNLSKFINGYH